jgi:hypothetical protein
MLFLLKDVHHRVHHRVTHRVIITTLKTTFEIPIPTNMLRFNHTKDITPALMSNIYHQILEPMKDTKHRFATPKVIPTPMYPLGQLRSDLLQTIQVITPLMYQVVHLFTTMWLPVRYSSMRTFSVKPIILFTGSNLP